MLTCRNVLLFIFSASLFTPVAFADNHTVTVFQCVNKNQKKVNVSFVDGQYTYTFGKLNQAPDITMTRKPEQLEGRYFNPKGSDVPVVIYEMDFRNGNYTYTISSTHLSDSQKAQVDVYQKEKLLTTVECVPNTVVDYLSEHVFDLPNSH